MPRIKLRRIAFKLKLNLIPIVLLLATSPSWAHKCPEGPNNYPECQSQPNSTCPKGRMCDDFVQSNSAPYIQVTGYSCANPWTGAEGPNYPLAMANADKEANGDCYPFQARRVSGYVLASNNRICAAHLFGAIATAHYSCAR
jgi:hypothetical protein